MSILGKTIISYWLNFYLLTKHFCFLVKPLGKTSIFSLLNFFLLGYIFIFQQNFYTFWLNISTYWLNLYFLANILHFLAKHLPLGKTFISSWFTFVSWQNFYFFLSKPIFLHKTNNFWQYHFTS